MDQSGPSTDRTQAEGPQILEAHRPDVNQDNSNPNNNSNPKNHIETYVKFTIRSLTAATIMLTRFNHKKTYLHSTN